MTEKGDEKGGENKADDNGSFEVDFGGEIGTKQFATRDEMAQQFVALTGEHAKTKGTTKELADLIALVKAATTTGNAEAERQLYLKAGMSQTDIDEIYKAQSEEEEEAGSGKGKGKGGEEAGEFQISDHIDEIVSRVAGKLDFSIFTPDALKQLRDLAERVEAASGVVTENSRERLDKILSADEVISKYWTGLNSRQKRLATTHVEALHGAAIKSGRRPTEEIVTKMRTSLRSFLADAYGPADEFRKGGSAGVPPVIDVGGSTTGLEDLSNKQLDEQFAEISDPNSDKAKGTSAFERRMVNAFERDKRARAAAR